ncbi:MAG TPA: hypothetical protein VHN11_17095 [Xanthobacteraceae bacterium]|nr:hypothetical protein [Xanthobacteraceae bacterium]
MHPPSAEVVFFDDEATRVMGEAFDEACNFLVGSPITDILRELIAARIIEVAKTGERDPACLHSRALMALFKADVSAAAVGIVRNVPVPVYALVSRTA